MVPVHVTTSSPGNQVVNQAGIYRLVARKKEHCQESFRRKRDRAGSAFDRLLWKRGP